MKELSLNEIKNIELCILKQFDNLCKENNLDYSVACGTMLGAVRHQGFIPWDDDIDVYMKRDDYEKLMSLQYEDERYEVKSYRYTKGYYYPFSKMIDKTTYLDEPWRCDKNMGVYIDIFPLDKFQVNCEEDKKLLLKNIHKRVYDAYNVGHKFSVHKRFSLRYLFKVGYLLLTYPFKKTVVGILDNYCRKNNNGNYYFMALYPTDNAFIDINLCENIIKTKFEDLVVSIYEEYDTILKAFYGDYMQLPPIEEQVSVHSFKAYKKD